MKNILKLLNQRPIAYYPIYRQIAGSTTAGILLSQLMYWFSKKDKFYKTDMEIREETLLTEKELKTAKSKLKKLSFIEITREGIPAKTYYQINWIEFERVLNFYTEPNKLDQKNQDSLDERDKLNGTNGTNCMEQKGQTITKNTTENTTNTKDNINKKTNKEISEKFSITSALQKSDIQQLLNDLKVKEDFLYELNNHRNLIDKPIKSEAMLRAVLKDIREALVKTKKSANEILTIMEEQGWKGINARWINNLEGRSKKKTTSKKSKGFDEERAKDAINGFLKMTEGGVIW